MTDVAAASALAAVGCGQSGPVMQPDLVAQGTAEARAEVVRLGDRGEFFVRSSPPGGAGLPLLLIHGWLATADLTFSGVYRRLGVDRSWLAADLRGHGRSVYPEASFTLEDAADDNAALLRHLGHDRAVVVGFSLGAAIAQVMVRRHPDLVAGLVLAGGELAPRRRPHEKLYLRAAGVSATVQRLTDGRWTSHRLVSKAEADEGRTPDRQWLVAEMERGHPASLRAAGRALARFDGRPIAAAHRKAVPAAVVLTMRDRIARPARQRDLAEAWGAEVVTVDGDHDVPIARPEVFADALISAADTVAGLGMKR